MDDGEIDIRATLGLLRRRFRLIATIVVVIVGAAALNTFALTPIYTATALLLVDPSRKDLLDPANQFGNSGSDSARVESEVELARSDAVLMQVIEDMQLVSDSEFGVRLPWPSRVLALLRLDDGALPTGDAALGDVLNRLRSAVTAQRRGGTYLIAVQARSQSAARAAELANAIAQTYIEDQLASKVASTLASRDILLARIEQARQASLTSAGAADQLAAGDVTPDYERQQNAAIARAQHETLLARAQDLSAQADLQLADSRVVSPALVPTKPTYPDPPLFLLLSAIAALGIGIGVAFLCENVIGGFTSEEQAESVLRVKVAASLPRLKSGRADQASFAELMVNAPISVFSESVRRIRASVDRAARDRVMPGLGIVAMVSSAASGEGKTTTALSLARSYALSGKSTLLVDCDLRKPSVHRQLGVEPSVGFLDYLCAEAGNAINIQAITAKDPLSPTTVIAGAHHSSIPTDQLIAGAAFAQLINAARRSFDVVVLDTPPIGPVVDGLYIAQHADVIVFVVRYSSTPQSEARKALASLGVSKPGGTEIVAALNQQDSSPQRYGKRAAYALPG
jgi:capsular exopolysaccharide synthesis family protein